jgi:copper chaperone NosL
MKMHLLLRYNWVILLFITAACNDGPKPINYGSDGCEFCQMTIVDKQHAAQVITEKGRNYKYDAIECMVNDLNKWERPKVKTHLVADYSKPGIMTNAITASYLVSEKIPSPMGAFLSAFANEAERDNTLSRSGGERLDWDQLIIAIDKKHIHNQ